MVGVGHVEIIQSPANPQDGEKIFAVEPVSLEVARERFEATGRLDLAELYQLASEIATSDFGERIEVV